MSDSDSSEMNLTNYMSLRILHEALDPDDVSRVLGLTPDRVRRRGDIITKTSSARRTTGYWSLHSQKHVPELGPFEDHARWLLDRIEPVADQLRSWSAGGWLVDLWLFVASDRGHGGPTMGADILRRLGTLGLDLNLDLYPTED